MNTINSILVTPVCKAFTAMAETAQWFGRCVIALVCSPVTLATAVFNKVFPKTEVKEEAPVETTEVAPEAPKVESKMSTRTIVGLSIGAAALVGAGVAAYVYSNELSELALDVSHYFAKTCKPILMKDNSFMDLINNIEQFCPKE